MKSKKFKYLDVLIDNPKSWMWQYVESLENILEKYGEHMRFFKSVNEIEHGDVMFVLSCDRILKKQDLQKHKNNIVIHESDLPKGKGWSPLSYQVEQGINKIPVTLFEATIKLDSGDWYIKDFIELDGTELVDNIRKKQAEKTFDIIVQYLQGYPMKPYRQCCDENFYEKRTSQNQELNINKTIKDQFNKLRVSDNQMYPAHFSYRGKKYILKIEEIE